MTNIINLSSYLPTVEQTLYNEPLGLPTGLSKLDTKIRGLKPSELIILAGRPSMGKSSCMVDMVLNIGVDKTPLIFTLEMSAKLLIERMITNLAKVSYIKLKANNLLGNELQRVDVAKKELVKRSILIDDSTLITPASIRNQLTEVIKTYNIDAIFIDYLQLMSMSTYLNISNRQQEITAISRELKALAKEFNIPFVILCQLNRSADYRESTSYRPRLSDLRESGSIEQDADIVLLLYRPSYYDLLNNPNATDNGQAEVIVAKNRNGSTGIVKCLWDREAMSFSDPININLEEF